MKSVFIDSEAQTFSDLEAFPGASWTALAELVPRGSIHRLKMAEGTVIPPIAKTDVELMTIRLSPMGEFK